MQPQGPFQSPGQGPGQIPGQPQMPYDPRNPQAGAGGPVLPGQTVGPNPYGAPGSIPGQPPVPGQPGQPLPPPPPPNLNAPLQPQIPGQPAVPGYQLPVHLANGQPVMPAGPAATATPYDFFMDAPKPAAPANPLPLKGKRLGNIPSANVTVDPNGKKKFLMLGGGGIVVVIILMAIPALIPKDPAQEQFFGIAQNQQEIVRVCSEGYKRSKLRATRNFAITCSAAVGTNEKELLSYMSKVKFKYDPKLIGAKHSSQTDAKLKAATSSTTYDNTFRTIMQTELAAYDRRLTAQLGVTTGANGREVLTRSQRANELLIQMVKDDSDKTEATPLESTD